MLTPIYWAISWIMLRWHAVFDLAINGKQLLATSWDWVLAIVFLVITIRAVLFPVFVKQIKAQRAMQKLAPQIKQLQEKHKGDRQTLQQEMMALYQREKANPLMGCLPLLVQLPVFWSLFHVLRHLNPNRSEHTKTLYGWTVGQFDAASHARLFGAPLSSSFRSPAADVTALGASLTNVRIVAAVLIAIMIVTTYLTSRQLILKTGWSEDPQQRMVQKLMLYGIPVSLLVSGAVFPLGVVVYWVTTNLFSLGQQFWVLRKFPPLVPAPTGGAPVPAGARAAAPGARTGGNRAGSGANRAGSGSTPRSTAGESFRVRRARKATADTAIPAVKVDGKALAPKPGAKPIVNPKKGGGAATTGTSASTKKGNAGKRASS